ncbi:MAG: carboxypeptidase regulatory-like domain-containing protein [Candidatus Kapabacteria bacterium]|nr:carboxypeptidase regulatory-like domain-containing protein [Candidatus Kapabacteria bacterium]
MKNFLKRLTFTMPLIALGLIVFFACQDRVAAPSYNSTISGVIEDPQSYGVPNAIIIASDMTSKILSTDTTDEDGNYSLSNLPENFEAVNILITSPDFKPLASKLSTISKGKDSKKLPIQLMGQDTCSGKLKVTVLDKTTNEPVSGVEVRINREKTVIRKANTNNQGVVIFENMCAGGLWARIAKTGYRVIEQNFTQSGTDTTKLNFQFEIIPVDTCCKGVVTVTIKDSATGLPINGATIRLFKNGIRVGDDRKTNDNGVYIFTGMCPGDYQISYFKDSYTGAEYNFTLHCNDTVSYTRYLNHLCCNGKVRINVKDDQGNNLDVAAVSILKNNVVIVTQYTAMGFVVFRELCEGSYTFKISKQGYLPNPYTIIFPVSCNDSLTKDVQLNSIPDSCCKGTYTLTLLDSSNNNIPVPAAKVRFWSGDKYTEYITDGNGKVVITNICSGPYTVSYFKEGWTGGEYKIEFKCSETKMESKYMKENCCDGTIKINVKNDKTQDPLNGATVRIYLNGKLLTTLIVEGGFVKFTGLCAGTYSLSITKDGFKGIEFPQVIKCHDAIELSKALLPDTACCNGVVSVLPVDSTTRQALTGAKVQIRKNGTVLTTLTVENGNPVIFRGLCEGTYNFVLSFNDKYYTTDNLNVTIKCNDEFSLTKGLLPVPAKDTCCRNVIKIGVTDTSNGNAIQNALIRLFKGGTQVNSKYTGDNGYVTFGELCAGTYSISANKDGYNGKELGQLVVTCTDTLVRNLALKAKVTDTCKTAVIRVQAKDTSDNSFIVGATVQIRKNGVVIASGTTNSEGWFAADGLAGLSTYSVRITKDGYVAVEKSFTFTNDCGTKSETAWMHK